MFLNYYVSPGLQLILTLQNAKWIIKNKIEIEEDPMKLLRYAVDNYGLKRS